MPERVSYRGVSFLKFLLSREDDVETYCQRRREKRRPPRLEIYPKGFPPVYGKANGNTDIKE